MTDKEKNKTEDVVLHTCGYVEDTFACKIRHQAVMTGNTEARKHNAEIQRRWQEKNYGL